MNVQKQHSILVFMIVWIGSVFGLFLWIVAGCPPFLVWTYMGCAIAFLCCIMVVLLMTQRNHTPFIAADDGDDDVPMVTARTGTGRQRTEDLNAYVRGFISLEDYLDRWAGREVVDEEGEARRRNDRILRGVERDLLGLSDLTDTIKKELEAAVLEALRMGPPSTTVPCDTCLGLHKPNEKCPLAKPTQVCLRPYMKSMYTKGDKVRTNGAATPWNGVIATLKELREDGDWIAEYGGALLILDEKKFEIARPRGGEVWYAGSCLQCEQAYPTAVKSGEMYNINHDWVVSVETALRIRCGCFYKLGIQDAKS